MNRELTLLSAVVILCILYRLAVLYRKYRPHLITVLLPDRHRKIVLCWWSYYYWYDIRGTQVRSRRIKRKTLLRL